MIQKSLALIFFFFFDFLFFKTGFLLYMRAKLLQLCPTPCSPMDCSLTGSSVHGILQAFPPPGHLPNPGIKPMSFSSPALAGGFFTTSATWEATSHIYMFF